MKCLAVLILAVFLVAAEGKALPAGENQQAVTQTFQLPSHLQQETERVLLEFTKELAKEVNDMYKEEDPNAEGKPTWARDFRALMRNIVVEMKSVYPEKNSFGINLITEMTIKMTKKNNNPQTRK